MKRFKNKKTFLLFLLGFYALVAIFTGTAMYLPYIDTGEVSSDEETSEEEDYTEEDGSDETEAETDSEDTEEEVYSEDEDYSDEDNSSSEEYYPEHEDYFDEDNSSYEEDSSENDDYSDEEDTSDNPDYSTDLEGDNTDNAVPTNIENTENPDNDIPPEEDTAIPHTEDTENGIYDDSIAVPTPIPENTAETVQKDFPLAFSYRGTGKLNIRKEPSKAGSIVGKISKNSNGMILEFANDEWAKITYNDIEGYVAYEYIEYSLPEGTVTPAPTQAP